MARSTTARRKTLTVSRLSRPEKYSPISEKTRTGRAKSRARPVADGSPAHRSAYDRIVAVAHKKLELKRKSHPARLIPKGKKTVTENDRGTAFGGASRSPRRGTKSKRRS